MSRFLSSLDQVSREKIVKTARLVRMILITPDYFKPSFHLTLLKTMNKQSLREQVGQIIRNDEQLRS
jgi:hypothetical protein